MLRHRRQAAGAFTLSAHDLAAQALAELEQKLDAGIEAVRARSAEAKSKLENGMLNLRSHADRPSAAPSPNGIAEPSWDLESAAAADAATDEQLDDLAIKPFDDSSFGDDFDGIPEPK